MRGKTLADRGWFRQEFFDQSGGEALACNESNSGIPG